ncbi:hypothetical protein Kisp01_50110 [Kineosporia sp. NBRC 101677]|uniref:hypothetical protein n=1 Tax=Kineosporia sp. NBRC 101677 TaxID=3032197 RepID=UPI0024A5DC37|nr:hypothetical protein [Kineosporia sp. NBRC 101677]GLY17997.1 hypothetical protein Kisp01_50110 [Kineosporia sp. NBRC 101677]
MHEGLTKLTQHRPLRWTAASIVLLALVLIGWFATERETAAEPPPAVAETTAREPGITVEEWAPTQPDVTWQDFANVNLPVSASAGPYVLTPTRAFGFSRDDAGAALAAVHILVRAFPGAGSDSFVPTIREQVTGTAREQLAARTQSAYDGSLKGMDGVEVGEPLPLGQGWIVAYRMVSGVRESSDGARTVQVLVEGSGETLGYTEYTVDLQWIDDDWRIEAPRWGDWGSVARPVEFPYPTSYRSYDDITANLREAS